MTTVDKLVGITAQHNEIVKRVGNGSLNTDVVRRALQDIIEGKFASVSSQLPSWYVSPERQLERARQLWPQLAFGFPNPPMYFAPRSDTEVLLLHVPCPFDALWSVAQAPNGYTKWRWHELEADKLRLAPSVPKRADPVWLAFDYAANHGVTPNKLWGQSNLAATEVISAVIQFPDWVKAWDGKDTPYPILSGFQFYSEAGWSSVPSLYRWDGDQQLQLVCDWAHYTFAQWGSPVVREC